MGSEIPLLNKAFPTFGILMCSLSWLCGTYVAPHGAEAFLISITLAMLGSPVGCQIYHLINAFPMFAAWPQSLWCV